MRHRVRLASGLGWKNTHSLARRQLLALSPLPSPLIPRTRIVARFLVLAHQTNSDRLGEDDSSREFAAATLRQAIA